jgi:glycosyltransferase involved in cell wall biosynthesis
VSTSVGVNGLDVTAGFDFLLAETAAEIAAQITLLQNDPALRKSIETNARQKALRFDWRAIGIRQHALYDRLLCLEAQLLDPSQEM